MLHQFKKILFAMSIFCFAAFASANTADSFNPSVGDFAAYQDSDGYQWKMIISAYRKDRDTFELSKYSLLKDGRELFAGRTWRTATLLKNSYIQDIESFCQSRKGTLEDLDIANRTMKSCKIATVSTDQTTTYWYGSGVPLSILKTEITYKESGRVFGNILTSYGHRN